VSTILTVVIPQQRFDETGKGKGKEGREEVVKATGYVTGFDPNKAKAPPKQASGTSIFDKLTDTSQYTGSHKHRFDETGKGKGKEGREEVVKATGYVTGFDPEKAKAPPKQGKQTSSYFNNRSVIDYFHLVSFLQTNTASGTSIFDKLNDPTQYTGSHKNRFDKDGKGNQPPWTHFSIHLVFVFLILILPNRTRQGWS